jgi:hypothetical protein
MVFVRNDREVRAILNGSLYHSVHLSLGDRFFLFDVGLSASQATRILKSSQQTLHGFHLKSSLSCHTVNGKYLDAARFDGKAYIYDISSRYLAR